MQAAEVARAPTAPSRAPAIACSAASPSEWPCSRGAPAISTPPRRRPSPGPNGWRSDPNPVRVSPTPGEPRLGEGQVVRARDLEVRGLAGDCVHRDPGGLEQRRLVGQLGGVSGPHDAPAPGGARPSARPAASGPSPHRAIDRARDQVAVDALERLGHRQHRDGRAVLRRRARNRLDERGAHQRTGTVVHQQHARAGVLGRGRSVPRRRVERPDPRRDGFLAPRAARDDRDDLRRQPGRPGPAPRRRCGRARSARRAATPRSRPATRRAPGDPPGRRRACPATHSLRAAGGDHDRVGDDAIHGFRPVADGRRPCGRRRSGARASP